MPAEVVIHSNRCPAIAARFEPAVRDITQAAVFQVVARADPATPVDTGNLKNNKSIGPDFVHWHAAYAAFVDKGTVRMAPRLFATNAANTVFPEWTAALAQIERRL
jgi:hypothetical protein